MSLLALAGLLATTALAHPELTDPPPRYPSDGFTANKACPCGEGLTSRLCDDANDRSDGDRNDGRATTYTAGETITVRWNEVVAHTGRYRIAFDEVGADMADFNGQILADIPDPPGREGNVGQADLWELEVTLPNTPCDNCTLQLVQIMDGDMSAPVPDPAGRSSYYQCADLILLDPNGAPTTGTTGTTTTTPTTPTGTATNPIDDTGLAMLSESGCGCSTAGGSGGFWPLAMWALLGLRRARSA